MVSMESSSTKLNSQITGRALILFVTQDTQDTNYCFRLVIPSTLSISLLWRNATCYHETKGHVFHMRNLGHEKNSQHVFIKSGI